jgi:hypothetical protein
MSVEYKTRLRDYIRMMIGDQGAEDLLTDTQIDSVIEGNTLYGNRQTERLVCYSNVFRSSYPDPVHNMLIDTPVSDDHVYRVDESTKFVEYISGGTAPDDKDEITITYVLIKFNRIMADCFEILASAHVKMVSVQSVGGISIDATRLTKEFQRQAQYWACKDQW